MESSKNPFNRYSENLKPKSLAKGKVALFEIVGGRRDLLIPSTDLIWDEGKNDYVQIACVKRLSNEGKPEFEDIKFIIRKGGILKLVAGNQRHDRVYKYFQLTNYNGSNPLRDPSARILFKELKPEENAKNARDKRKEKAAAFAIVSDMSDEAILTHFKSTDSSRINEFRDKIELAAEKNPSTFLKQPAAESMEVASSEVERKCKLARKKEIIDFDKESFTWKFVDGDDICTIPRVAGVKQYAELVSHLMNDKKGKEQYELILKGLSEE
jgi:hypothetical protein